MTYKAKILIVDDDAIVRELIESHLSAAGGYVLESAANGAEALERPLSSDPRRTRQARMGGRAVRRGLSLPAPPERSHRLRQSQGPDVARHRGPRRGGKALLRAGGGTFPL